MIKAVLDTNILLDFLLLRESYEGAARIMNFAVKEEFKAYASAHEITTLAYFMEKDEIFPGEFRKKLSELFSAIQILPVDQGILEKAMYSRITDYEDAVLEAVALKNGVEIIVTRNMKDFSHSKVRAMNPARFLEIIEKKPPGDLVKEPTASYRTRPRRRTKKKQS